VDCGCNLQDVPRWTDEGTDDWSRTESGGIYRSDSTVSVTVPRLMRLVLISSPSCRIRALHPVSLRATTSTYTIQTLWETCHIPVADLKSIHCRPASTRTTIITSTSTSSYTSTSISTCTSTCNPNLYIALPQPGYTTASAPAPTTVSGTTITQRLRTLSSQVRRPPRCIDLRAQRRPRLGLSVRRT
jgi:hypothetical protein